MELSDLLAALNRTLRGWANYFRHAVAKRTFVYLGYYAGGESVAGFARSTHG